ncbi:MAG TPA: hypothetical protein PKX07_21250, partial [Aggregatilineales bacterium]|nr:hypothetical protein [Aggregatilineales bacterium]
MIVHALRQLRRDLPVTAILLAALALVTGFAALAPLYVQMVAAAELDSRLALLTPRQQRLELSDARPVATDSLAPLAAALGDTLLATHRFGYAPARICGLGAEDGQRASYLACIRQYTYPDLDAEFTAVEGRLPQPDTDVIEFALTRGVLEKSARLSPDYRITIGSQYGIHDGRTLHTLRLVGIVEPRVPEFAPHWDGQQSVFGTIILSTGNQPDELDIGILIHPDVLAAPDSIDAPALRQYVTRAALDLTH